MVERASELVGDVSLTLPVLQVKGSVVCAAFGGMVVVVVEVGR
jgi:hypothetical protein